MARAESEFANLLPALRQAPAAGDALTWKLPFTVMVIFELLGHVADIIPGLCSALTASHNLGDRTAEAWILNALAEAYLHVGQPDKTIQACGDVRAITAGTGDWYSQWQAQLLEGSAHLALGRSGEALELFQQSLATGRRASDIRTQGMSLTWLGAVHESLGSFETAISLREQAVTALKQARNRWQHAFALHQLAETCHRHGRTSDAIGHYQQAQEIFRQTGDRRTEAGLLLQLGHAQETTGQAGAARQSRQQALAILTELHDPRADHIRTQLRTEASNSSQPIQIAGDTAEHAPDS